MKILLAIAAALLLSLTGCAVYVPAAQVGVRTPNVAVTVGYGYPAPVYGYPRYYSPYDSGPFGYSPEVQARGSYYTPQMVGPNCNHRHHH
jgi:hypothetical protein